MGDIPVVYIARKENAAQCEIIEEPRSQPDQVGLFYPTSCFWPVLHLQCVGESDSGVASA